MNKLKTFILLSGLFLASFAYAATPSVIQVINASSPLKTMSITYEICGPITCAGKTTINMAGGTAKAIINPLSNDNPVYFNVSSIIEKDENGNQIARNISGCKATKFSDGFVPVLIFNDYSTNMVVCQDGLA